MAVARDPSLVGVANREPSVLAEQTWKYYLNTIIVFPENDAMRAFEEISSSRFLSGGSAHTAPSLPVEIELGSVRVEMFKRRA